MFQSHLDLFIYIYGFYFLSIIPILTFISLHLNYSRYKTHISAMFHIASSSTPPKFPSQLSEEACSFLSICTFSLFIELCVRFSFFFFFFFFFCERVLTLLFIQCYFDRVFFFFMTRVHNN